MTLSKRREKWLYICEGEDGDSCELCQHPSPDEAEACSDGTYYQEVWQEYVGGELWDADVGWCYEKPRETT